MIVRFEPWGAWVKAETMAAIVALDREGVRALGLDGKDAWSEGAKSVPSPPIEVHLAVTGKCAVGCEGCYLDARPDGVEPPRETLLAEMDALRDAGVFTVAFGGGEPISRDDLGSLAEAARERGLTPVLTTSGFGLNPARIEQLRPFAQVNVSYDGAGEDYEAVRGVDGARAAERAITQLANAGILVGVNIVLTRSTFERVPQTIARARELGAREAQLLRYKPAGRAATLDYLARRLSPAQVLAVGPMLRELARVHAITDAEDARPEFRIRIDCAMVPFLSADAEIAANPELLVRMGVFGCEAAAALTAVRVDGRVAPCSFAQPTDLRAEQLATDHATDPELTRWRAYVDAPAEPCASCTLRPVCKGGCKVVASFVDGAHGPDPECPRVRAHRGRS